jgi:energy-coupling factor transporter ATP-binding protein EcfA2
MLDPVILLADIVSAEFEAGEKPALCMILGAGASISSGGETFLQLKERLISRFYSPNTVEGDDVATVQASEGLEEFFERLFRAIQSPQTRTKILRDAFPDRPLPSDGYMCVALLCAAGAVRSIVTTNFDRYLESAVRTLGVDKHIHVIYAGGEYDRGVVQAASAKRTVVYKIHGDAELGIYNITNAELNAGDYPSRVKEVVTELIGTNHLVVSGYSGSEQKIAALFLANSASSDAEVFWLNPSPLTSDRPLFAAIKDRIVQSEETDVALRFDPAMKRLIGSLDSALFNGRTGLFRSHTLYAADVAKHTAQTLRVQNYLRLDDPLYVRRRKVLDCIRDAINLGGKLVAIIGPSGYGKSTLMPALISELTNGSGATSTTVLLSVGGDLRANVTLEQHLAKVLGLSQLLAPSLVLMNSDLRQHGQRLVVIVDGIDQARSSIDEIKLLFRDIATFHAKCLADGINLITLVVSCRSEIWQAMSAPTNRYRIDISGTTEVPVGPYDDVEAEAAFLAYAAHHRVSSDFRDVSPDSRAMMREPILLRIICKAYEGRILPETLELHRVFDGFLQACFEGHRDYNALAFLETLAIKWLDPRIARDGAAFGDLPSEKETLGDNIDVALRAGIIRRTYEGQVEAYVFFHERVLELFMTRYLLRQYEGPLKNIRFTHDDLIEGLEHAADSKHAHGVFKMFLINPRSQKALGNCLINADEYTEAFLSECIIESSHVNPDAFTESFLGWFLSAHRPRIRAVLIQAAASSAMARNRLWDVIDRLEPHESALFLTASYYLLDGLAPQLEQHGKALLATTNLADLIHHSPGQELRSIGFVLYLLARCAPEYSDEDSWLALYEAARRLLGRLANDVRMPTEEMLRLLADRFAPRYAFNGAAATFDQFFKKEVSDRSNLFDVIRSIIDGVGPISLHDVDTILSCADESQSWFEKILLQPSLTFMANRDIARYRATIEQVLENSETASQADFCSGSVAYQVAANDYFDHEFSLRINAHCVDKRPDFLALEESYSELFNPIGTYGFTFPRFNPGQPVDLFRLAFEKFRAMGDEHLICRVLHALRQTLTLYPAEGLATLEPILDHPANVVRERIVALLAEGYMIEPSMVSKFVWRHDDAFTDEERHRILRTGQDQIHVHPITILEWGRVFRFLLWVGADEGLWRETLLSLAAARSFSDLFQVFLDLAVGRQTRNPDRNK